MVEDINKDSELSELIKINEEIYKSLIQSSFFNSYPNILENSKEKIKSELNSKISDIITDKTNIKFVVDSQIRFNSILNKYPDYNNIEKFYEYCSLENVNSLVEFIYKNDFSSYKIRKNLYENYYSIYNNYLKTILVIFIEKFNNIFNEQNICIMKKSKADYKLKLHNDFIDEHNLIFYKNISIKIDETFDTLEQIIHNIETKYLKDKKIYLAYKLLKILFFNIIFISKIFLKDIHHQTDDSNSYNTEFKKKLNNIEQQIDSIKHQIDTTENIYREEIINEDIGLEKFNIEPEQFKYIDILKNQSIDNAKLFKLRLSTFNLIKFGKNDKISDANEEEKLPEHADSTKNTIEELKKIKIEPCLFLDESNFDIYETYKTYFDHQFDHLFNKYEYGIYRIYDSL